MQSLSTEQLVTRRRPRSDHVRETLPSLSSTLCQHESILPSRKLNPKHQVNDVCGSVPIGGFALRTSRLAAVHLQQTQSRVQRQLLSSKEKEYINPCLQRRGASRHKTDSIASRPHFEASIRALVESPSVSPKIGYQGYKNPFPSLLHEAQKHRPGNCVCECEIPFIVPPTLRGLAFLLLT